MTAYVVLLRGINVGGKNPVPMARLRELLGELGYEDVVTYIASGNVILTPTTSPIGSSGRSSRRCRRRSSSTRVIEVLVLTAAQLQAVIANRPKGFGDEPGKYHSDAIFLMGIAAPTRWPRSTRARASTGLAGQRRHLLAAASAERTKSRLSKIRQPAYKSMTIRSWATTTKLAELVEAPEAGA